MISISSAFPVLPAQDSLYYELLALTAICGEVPCECADRLTSSKSYRKKVVTNLTHDKILRIFSKNHLRGYRLGIRGKRLLRERAPERFQFYLSGRTDTNSIKSSPARRLRLHRIAQAYVTMLNAGAAIYRDEKPPVFVPGGSSPCRIESTAFYDSREMKELGLEMIKVHGSRMVGSLMTPSHTFAVFNGMDAVPTFDTQIEQRGKIMLQNIRYTRTGASHTPDGILLSDQWTVMTTLLEDAKTYKKEHFLFGEGYEHFYFLTNDYSLYQRASDSVRSGVISGLGSRLQVFQSELIKKITAYDEISLELPGQQPCAYYLVTSDQDSTFDFLASLFLSFAFIKLVRYADANCPGGRLPVPVHVLGEELTACGTISELSRRISVIRSRNISMSCVFQNLAGLQNRYPQNQWQEILGNCDVQLFLGCTDHLTAEYVSQRTGIASVAVSSTSKALSTLRVSDYTPQYRESSGVGKRPVLTPDEVLRLPVDEALVILRGHKVLKVRKMDYSLHPAYKQLRECKASAHIPEWRKALPEPLETPPVETKTSPKALPKRRGRPAKSKTVVATDKESIITKPETEKEISHGNEQ